MQYSFNESTNLATGDDVVVAAKLEIQARNESAADDWQSVFEVGGDVTGFSIIARDGHFNLGICTASNLQGVLGKARLKKCNDPLILSLTCSCR